MSDPGKLTERVARILCRENGEEPDAPEGGGVAWHAYEQEARAAILETLKGIREPSAKMLEASNREWDGRMSYRSSGAWQAVIDALIKEIEHG